MPMRHLAKALIVVLALFSAPVQGESLTPILLSNGVDKLPCDGQMRFGWTAPLQGKTVVGTYLFGNLVTDPGHGADVVLWSPSYGGLYPPPWPNGASSQWGTVGDLHIFAQPAGHSGGRQGQSERWFPSGDGVLINDFVQIAYVCWGGGTLELYAQIWVK
jgi:hypothetical protein